MRLEKALGRFEDKVYYCPFTGCWLWTGQENKQGYGVFWFGGRYWGAHRWLYLHFVAPADQLDLDHLCRVRSCVNPEHLEPVTHQENCRRAENIGKANAAKTQCKHGHGFTPDNTYVSKSGQRQCKTCDRDRKRKAYRDQLAEPTRPR